MKNNNPLKSVTAPTILFLVIFTSTLVTSSFAAKNVYKCVKPNGEIEYTQFSSEECDSQPIRQRGGIADQDAIDNLREGKKREKMTADEQHEQQLARQDQARTKKEKEEYCENVRKNLEQIANAHRVFETDDQGNRTRLDEEQRQQRIQENKDSLAEHCD